MPELRDKLLTAARSRADLFVTVGQAGSGKTTATLQVLLDLSQEGDFDVFELSADTRSVAKSIDVLKRLSDKPKLVYLPNLFVFSTQLKDDFPEARSANIVFVSTARSSEWKEHFERHFLKSSVSFPFQRFTREDYEPLITRLKNYVPSPSFVKLKPSQQTERLAKSRNQLLIALREATESKNFDDIIKDEFDGLVDNDAKQLFILVGIATLARVGIHSEVAAEAYKARARKIDFHTALEKLDGIVAPLASGRLVARHEFYVRSILDQAVPVSTTMLIIQDMLQTYTKYDIPITRHVSRPDAALFRFLLNHSFLRERSEQGGDKSAGLEVYKRFEIDFQLDGHFWLQYGLYYQRLGNSQLAIEMLEQSIKAFPGNPFAIHALAAERLNQAGRRLVYNHETITLIRLAVKELELLHANPQFTFDQYPLVTLARNHVPVLLHHKQIESALIVARDYFERLRAMERIMRTDEIDNAKGRLFKFVSTRVWES